MRFLIVRACAIGDFVLNLPALRALARAQPQATFTLIGYPETLALARAFIPVDAIHSIEAQPWSQLFTHPAHIARYDGAWVWMRDSTFSDNLKRSGMPHVFHAEAFPPRATLVHAAGHLLRTTDLPAPELPDLWDARNPAVLHPGSGSNSKVWPYFEALARSIPEAKILLGPCERPLNVPNACLRDLSLIEVADVLRHCRLFVGNDSGITHIAAYWGAPTVALFGPTDSRIWGPLGRRVQVIQKPALADISVSDVRKLL
jgi:heptosyltransferase-2